MEGTETATRLVVSYPADLSDWGRYQVEKPAFQAFIRKTWSDIEEGDIFEEFVGVGCCGDTLDVPLRVETLDDGRQLGDETPIEFVERAASGIDGCWRVQSAGGPRR